MKISCLIDSLNSGGAQRQLCMLAVELKRLGLKVEIITYYNFDFFLPLIEQEQISLKYVDSKNKFHRILKVRKAIRESRPDIVVSYLHTPNILAELAGFPFRHFGLIVSERNTEYKGSAFKYLRRFLFHLLADTVVTNSFAQADFITDKAPFLKSRLATIPNCVDLDRFRPAREIQTADGRILVLGRFEAQKNPLALLSAIEILVKEYGNTNVRVDWYGNDFFLDGKPTAKSYLFLRLKKEIEQRSLSEHFHLHPQEKNVVRLYQAASAVCLPSLHEGCSNVICEAMACGKPVLASGVGDNPLLVEEGVTGFLFPPGDPRKIADAILRFMSLSANRKNEMSQKCREKAERNFSRQYFVEQYLDLFEKIKAGSAFSSTRARIDNNRS
jgi:glycosyltransferase involved in cell wall biosynthesis